MAPLPLTVVWVAGRAESPLLAGTADVPLAVITSRATDSQTVVADVRVLATSAFDDAEHLAVAYPLDPRPTLLLGRDAGEVEALLALARSSDEVGHAGESPALLLRRLVRLAARAESDRRLDEAQDHDLMTGLWNRQRLAREVRLLLDRLPTGTAGFALVLFDVDHFKRVNDVLGHQTGDLLLRQLATTLRRSLRPADMAARLGGDEFVALIHRPDAAAALADAETLRQQLAVDAPTALATSAGVALYQPGLNLDEWLRRADAALYEAKSGGRGRLASYDSIVATSSADEHELQVRHFQNVTRVVTERVANLIALMGQQVLDSIRRDANEDALTAIHNRRYFDNRIAREFELAAKEGRRLALAFLDIDNFGAFNRHFGAPTGDAVLRQFADVVAMAIRPTDWLARYGGEEFCVVMPVGVDDALLAAERMRAAVAEAAMHTAQGEAVNVTVSIGVAEYLGAGDTPVELVQRASKALQRAKQAGRDRVLK